MCRRRYVVVFMLAVIIALFSVRSGAEPEKVYTFSIVPQQSASKLARLWTPVMNYLGRKSGHKIRFTTARSIPEFENRLGKKMYDFSYMNPYHYTVFHESGYQALAKARDKRIQGIIVVSKESAYMQLEEFENKELAFPSPAAFAASILPQGEFRSRGINIIPKYVQSHDSVYHNVASGRYIAGGGVVRTLKNTPKNIRDKLKIMWKTPGYTPHAVAVHTTVPANVVKDVKAAILNMDKDDEGRKLLASIKIDGFVKAADSDWDDVRRLGINIIK